MQVKTCVKNRVQILNTPSMLNKKSDKVYNFLINIHLYNLKLVDEIINYVKEFVDANKNNYTIMPTIVVDSNFDSYTINNNNICEYNKDEFYDNIKNNIMCDNDLVMKHLDKIYDLTKRFDILNVSNIFVFIKNKGADIGGLMKSFEYIKNNNVQFDVYAHIHTKTDPLWRKNLMQIFKIKNINFLLDNYDLIGNMRVAHRYNEKDENTHYVNMFRQKYNLKLLSDWFVGGTMFICKKTDALISLMSNADKIYDELNDITTVDEFWQTKNKNTTYNNNFHAQSLGQNINPNCMKEHAIERIMCMIFDNHIYIRN